jgi:hypothetical protein
LIDAVFGHGGDSVPRRCCPQLRIWRAARVAGNLDPVGYTDVRLDNIFERM